MQEEDITWQTLCEETRETRMGRDKEIQNKRENVCYLEPTNIRILVPPTEHEVVRAPNVSQL